MEATKTIVPRDWADITRPRRSKRNGSPSSGTGLASAEVMPVPARGRA